MDPETNDTNGTAATLPAGSEADAPPFEDSRRLNGPSPYFDGTGAVLETAIGPNLDPDLLAGWRRNVERARRALGWPPGTILARLHAGGATLAFEAPFDQLYAATEVNEWAWLEALHAHGRPIGAGIGLAPGHAAAGDIEGALRSLAALARDEARPELVVLADAAQQHWLPILIDDDAVSVGTGCGSRSWPIDRVPAPDEVEWPALHTIPTALVTGTNGKTTTVRLLAAMLREHGLHTAHSCTDGLYFDGALLEGGDYSGPGGARMLLRNHAAQAAVLETARGGMLRHGLALRHADVAVITNVQADHLGEYGIDDLDGLARVKLTVARTIDDNGMLVLNADDAHLVRLGMPLDCPRAWFALDDGHPLLVAHRAAGGTTCAPCGERLLLASDSRQHDLGAIAAMPVTLAGSARYNIGNAAAASLAAHALGVPVPIIATVLARFGSQPEDNPGRLQHWQLGGVHAFVDFAHNPDGLRGLLAIANHHRGAGRLVLTLGQAGDRSDADLRELAATAAASHPERVLVKDVVKYRRGRNPGEVPRILGEHLGRCGMAPAHIECVPDEVDAARAALAWARPGDVLVLQALATDARTAINQLLSALHDSAWQPGQALPVTPAPPDANAKFQGMPA